MSQRNIQMLLVLVLAVGLVFIGMKDLRKLKAENEKRFGEVDEKKWDTIVAIYLTVYMLFMVYAIPFFFDSSFIPVHRILNAITGVLLGVWAAGLSTPYYNYLTVSQEKASIVWKMPVVTLAMLWHGLWNATGPLESGRPVALFIFVSTLEFVIRILLRRVYIKMIEKR